MPPILEAALSSVDNLNVGVLDLVVNSFRFVGVGMANLVRFLFSYKLIGHMSDCIFSECEKIVKLRRESTIHRSDLLEALLNANGEEAAVLFGDDERNLDVFGERLGRHGEFGESFIHSVNTFPFLQK